MEKDKIIIDNAGESVFAYASGYLDGTFWDFRDACVEAGAAWNRERGADSRYVIAAVDGPALVQVLQDAGFDVQVTPTAADIMKISSRASDAASERLIDSTQAHIESLGLPFYGYQENGVSFLRARMRALLADDMGLGKSIQALGALDPAAMAVVVCPAGIKESWRGQVTKWRPDLEPVVLSGRGSFRWPDAGEVIIVNPEILPETPAIAMQGRPQFEMLGNTGARRKTVIIADEAHYFKGSAKKVARVRRFRALVKEATGADGRVWLLTGTPMKNRPNELWNLLQSAGLAKEAYGSWHKFLSAFNAEQGRFGIEWGEPTKEAAAGLERVSLRRCKGDVLPDLPSKRIEDVSVAVGSMRICDKVMEEIPEGFDLTRADFDALKSVLAFDKISAARAALAKAKIPALVEHVIGYEEAETPLVVFSAHRAPIDALGERDGWAVVTGDTPSEERGRIQERFQAGELKGIAGTYGAMGTGVTLTAAADMILCDLPWTPADLNQAMDRIHRIGQESSCLYKILHASHNLDALVNNLIIEKSGLIDEVIDATNDASNDGKTLSVDAEKRTDELLETVDIAVAPEPEPDEEYADPRVKGYTELTEAQISWVFKGLAVLSAECDGAVQKDFAGFSRIDAYFGYDLAKQSAAGSLTPPQIEHAAELLKKYHRQIGKFPA
jgi:SWI/SNF-related matrix-associated actin-dependent regulator of chromatin subfamily A-like protein 1